MITVSEISQRLADKVLDTCLFILPGGKESKGVYVCGDINGSEGHSLQVNLSGQHVGKWRDWADQDHRGDLLDLWRIRRNISAGEAVRQAKEWLGIAEPRAMQEKVYSKAPVREYRPPNPVGKAMEWLTKERKLSPEIISLFKIEVKADEPRGIVFPCISPTGEVINRSFRSLPKEGEKKKVWQEKGCAPCLFGWQALTEEALITRTVILTEGQIDACSYRSWGFPALSIPNGSGMTWIDYNWTDLQAFDHIYLSFDMDDAGRKNCREVVKRLGPHRCYIVEIPRKDANTCLQEGFTAKDAHKWISSAKMPEFDGIVVASDLANRISADLVKKEEPFSIACLAGDWSLQTGLFFRPGEVTVWTGRSSAGKSTFLNHVALCAILTRRMVFICSLEVRVETTVRRMAHASIAKQGLPRTEANFLMWLKLCGPNIILTDVVGYIQQDVLFEMMQFAFHRYGVTHFFIDSLMRVDGLEEDNIAQGKFLNRLQEFVKTTGAHVHLVAHPGKPKDKDRRVDMLDVKGSSLIINNADNIVVVTRNGDKAAIKKERDLSDDEEKMHDTEITVEKQRESGWVGTFYLKFNPHDYTFAPCQKYIPPKEEKKPYQKNNWNKQRY